jgi:hypothetical protein
MFAAITSTPFVFRSDIPIGGQLSEALSPLIFDRQAGRAAKALLLDGDLTADIE